MSKNIYWRELNGAAVVDRGASYTTEEGDLIFWHGHEAYEAQLFLKGKSSKAGPHTQAFNRIMSQHDKPKEKKIFMKPTGLNPDHALSESLQKCTVESNTLFLPPMSDGPLPDYKEIREALIKAGGKYNKNKFVFPSDVMPYLVRITAGEKVNIKKEFQFFGTPAALADRLVELADIELWHNGSILEPSAGQGAIIDAIFRAHPAEAMGKVHAFELMDINRSILEKNPRVILMGDDFLKFEGFENHYARIIANPPFSKNQDIDHIRKMYEVLKPGGRIVTIASKHWQHASGKKEKAFKQWLDDIGAVVDEVPAGEFKESGTSLATCIIVIDK